MNEFLQLFIKTQRRYESVGFA